MEYRHASKQTDPDNGRTGFTGNQDDTFLDRVFPASGNRPKSLEKPGNIDLNNSVSRWIAAGLCNLGAGFLEKLVFIGNPC